MCCGGVVRQPVGVVSPSGGAAPLPPPLGVKIEQPETARARIESGLKRDKARLLKRRDFVYAPEPAAIDRVWPEAARPTRLPVIGDWSPGGGLVPRAETVLTGASL